MLSFLVFLVVLGCASAQGNPNNLVCENVASRPETWQTKLATVMKFNGLFRADGDLTFYGPGRQVLLSLNFNGSVWSQYFNANGLLIGDLFLSGAAFGVPGYAVLTSRQVSNMMVGSERVCQKFLAPSPTDLINSYSLLEADDLGYMTSRYYSLDSATFKRIFSIEHFHFDLSMTTAFSETNTINLADGIAHFVTQTVNFNYVPITLEQANALGYNNANVASATASQKGFAFGRGAIPLSVLTPAQRALIGL